MRALRRAAFNDVNLKTTGMEFASEMVVKARFNGLRMSEVPIVLHPDGRGRPSHLRSFRDGWRHLRFLLILCPLWLYFIPSSILLTVGSSLMISLTPGPLAVGGVILDLHTMLFASVYVLLGYETLWLFAAHTKVLGLTKGLLPRKTFSLRVVQHLNLERGLIAGGAMLLLGVGLGLWLLYGWYRSNSGVLDVRVTLRSALWACTFMVLGMQTIYGSFFVGTLAVVEDTKK